MVAYANSFDLIVNTVAAPSHDFINQIFKRPSMSRPIALRKFIQGAALTG
jgi:hypothetical protein